MALKKLPYRKLDVLLTRYLSTEEDARTAALICGLRQARVRGYLTRAELEKVSRWKSARAIHLIKNNSVALIRTATGRMLATRSERRRLEILRTLQGVSVPMASAILTLLDPRRYGVFDIHVWQLLHAMGAVRKKPDRIGLDFNNWYQFLMIIRYFAKKLHVGARDIERSLFLAHRAHQTGTLYRVGVSTKKKRDLTIDEAPMRVVNRGVTVCLFLSLVFAFAIFYLGWIDPQGAASRMALPRRSWSPAPIRASLSWCEPMMS